MKNWLNMLLVGGTGRNVGKTTFVCSVINKLSKNQPIIAIKITPHTHELERTCEILQKTDDFLIAEEKNPNSNKDSSKMLAAGAQKVYYVQGTDNQLEKIINFLQPLIPKNHAIICESAALRNVIRPGIFILMSVKKPKTNKKNTEKVALSDFHFWDYNYNIENFNFNSGIWKKYVDI